MTTLSKATFIIPTVNEETESESLTLNPVPSSLEHYPISTLLPAKHKIMHGDINRIC